MKSFDFYEFNAVLTPGVIALYAAMQLFPQAGPLLAAKDFTVGDLGLFVVLAFVAGHLMQALGFVLEGIFWRCLGGMPSGRLVRENQKLLSPAQYQQLPARLAEILRLQIEGPLTKLNETHWHPITRQIYVAVQAAGRSQRTDIFNANYGLFRGIASAFIAIMIAHAIITRGQAWPLDILLVACAGLAFARMHRFGVHYASELFVQFLQLKPQEESSNGVLSLRR